MIRTLSIDSVGLNVFQKLIGSIQTYMNASNSFLIFTCYPIVCRVLPIKMFISGIVK